MSLAHVQLPVVFHGGYSQICEEGGGEVVASHGVLDGRVYSDLNLATGSMHIEGIEWHGQGHRRNRGEGKKHPTKEGFSEESWQEDSQEEERGVLACRLGEAGRGM